jgi:hypothetical protein
MGLESDMKHNINITKDLQYPQRLFFCQNNMVSKCNSNREVGLKIFNQHNI